MNRSLAAALAIGTLLWAAIIIAAPRGASDPRLAGPAAYVYAAASRICHQKAERSFRAAGFQMPVCARCSGLYAGAAAGVLLAFVAWGDLRSSRVRLLLGLAAAPTAVTWLLETTGWLPFSNTARAVAALPLGAVGGWLFVGMLRYDAGLDGRQIHDSRTGARSL